MKQNHWIERSLLTASSSGSRTTWWVFRQLHCRVLLPCSPPQTLVQLLPCWALSWGQKFQAWTPATESRGALGRAAVLFIWRQAPSSPLQPRKTDWLGCCCTAHAAPCDGDQFWTKQLPRGTHTYRHRDLIAPSCAVVSICFSDHADWDLRFKPTLSLFLTILWLSEQNF